MQPASKMKLAPAPWSAASPWFLSVPCLTSLVVLFDYFFNSVVVKVPCSLIFWQFWLFIDFRLVVILLLVVGGREGFLPMPPSWPELPGPTQFLLTDFFSTCLFVCPVFFVSKFYSFHNIADLNFVLYSLFPTLWSQWCLCSMFLFLFLFFSLDS